VFREFRLPMKVACANCRMTMTLLSASCLVDDAGTVWCSDCAPFPSEEGPEIGEDGRPDYFQNEVAPIERVRARFLRDRDLYAVMEEEEYDIVRDVLSLALFDPTVSEEAKGHVREALDKTFTAPHNCAWDQGLDEFWGILEGSLADPEEEIS